MISGRVAFFVTFVNPASGLIFYAMPLSVCLVRFFERGAWERHCDWFIEIGFKIETGLCIFG